MPNIDENIAAISKHELTAAATALQERRKNYNWTGYLTGASNAVVAGAVLGVVTNPAVLFGAWVVCVVTTGGSAANLVRSKWTEHNVKTGNLQNDNRVVAEVLAVRRKAQTQGPKPAFG